MSIKQYNRNKPTKYGPLFRSVNAARYPYTFFSAPYSGKPQDDPTEHYVVGTDALVQYLINQLKQYMPAQGRNISTDRYYVHIHIPRGVVT